MLQSGSEQLYRYTDLSVTIKLIRTFDYAHGRSISSGRIELIAYFAAAWHLAIYDTPLFYQPILATSHRPCISDFDLSFQASFDDRKYSLPEHSIRLVETICKAYSSLNTRALLALAKSSDSAWAIARIGVPCDISTSIYPEVLKRQIWITAKEEILDLPL